MNENSNLNNKSYYTIEDLVTLYYKADKKAKELSNMNLDIEALKNKIANMELKIKNATLYIDEIDKHKKSIFEFWKFANKDELQALEVGTDQENKNKKQIRKIFKYEFDFEDFAIQMDKLQRVRMSKDEQDSAFLATTDLLDVINNENLLEESLNSLKKEQEDNVKVYNLSEFDIFGNMQDNRAKTKNLGNQKHRENKKDKLRILGITKNINLEEYSNKIKNIKDNLKESLKKIKSQYDMSIYIVSQTNEVLKKEFEKYYINLEDALNNSDIALGDIDVYKINIQEGMPLICCTNIIFYDNFNKTLPEGMNEEKSVILKNDSYKFENTSTNDFRTNMYIKHEDLESPHARKVIVHEYNAKSI